VAQAERRTNRRAQFLAAAALLVLLAVTVVMVRNLLTLPYPGHNDFMSRWEGARSFFVDHLNPYGDQASLNIQQRIYGRPVHEGEDPGYFAYPLYTAILVWPLVYVSYDWASAIWMVLLAAGLIASLFMLFDIFRWRPSPLLLGFLMIWVLLFYFSSRGLILGQPGTLVYVLEVLTLWALTRKHDRLAGVALAVSTLKPQMGFLIVPFLLLWGLRERRWSFVFAFIVVMAALLGVSFVLLPSWVGDWLAQLRLYPSYTALGSPVWIITSYYMGLGGWAEALVNVALVGVVLWSWYLVLWRRQGEAFWWAVALTLTVTHLIAPRTATPHYVVFLIPLVFYCAQMRRSRQGGRWIFLLLLALLVLPWLQFLATVKSQFEHPTMYLPLPFGMLVALLLTRRLWAAHVPRMEAS
jgi:hypothetical protein